MTPAAEIILQGTCSLSSSKPSRGSQCLEVCMQQSNAQFIRNSVFSHPDSTEVLRQRGMKKRAFRSNCKSRDKRKLEQCFGRRLWAGLRSHPHSRDVDKCTAWSWHFWPDIIWWPLPPRGTVTHRGAQRQARTPFPLLGHKEHNCRQRSSLGCTATSKQEEIQLCGTPVQNTFCLIPGQVIQPGAFSTPSTCFC